jgi:hypothetical protein
MECDAFMALVRFCSLDNGGSVKDRLAGVIGVHYLTLCPDMERFVLAGAPTLLPALIGLVARVGTPSAELRLGVEADVASLAAMALAHASSVLACHGRLAGAAPSPAPTVFGALSPNCFTPG